MHKDEPGVKESKGLHNGVGTYLHLSHLYI